MTTYVTDMPVGRRVFEVLLGPAIAGVVCGTLLQVNGWLYALSAALSFVSGLPAGAQHKKLTGAAVRGGVSGVLWGATLLTANQLLGDDPSVELPDPYVLLLVFSAGITALASVIVRLLGHRPTQDWPAS